MIPVMFTELPAVRLKVPRSVSAKLPPRLRVPPDMLNVPAFVQLVNSSVPAPIEMMPVFLTTESIDCEKLLL